MGQIMMIDLEGSDRPTLSEYVDRTKILAGPFHQPAPKARPMSESLKLYIVGMILGWVLGVCLGTGFGAYLASENMATVRKEAVEHGAAHWEPDAGGKTTFHWNNEKPEAEKP